jgi:hypothetical protein
MDGVPGAVDGGDFVGDEFYYIEANRQSDDPPMAQEVELSGKLDQVEALEQAQGSYRSVEIDPGKPSRAHGEPERTEPITHGANLR